MKNIWKHLKLISKHKLVVFYYCIKAGIPWRGFMHDWSKYSPTEFLESIKFYTGTGSPINEAKRIQGYSDAWLHHKGRNKHHYEYWIDNLDGGGVPLLIPYPYAMEMCCDMIAANKIYGGKNWTPDDLIKYWNSEKNKRKLHPAIKNFQNEVFIDFRNNGLSALNKTKTMSIYKKYTDNYTK